MRKYRFLRVLKMAVFAIVAVGAVSFVVMSLWNALIPVIFAVRPINYWQALGLLVLSKLLFGGFRPNPGGGGPRWRHRMAERWGQMSPEERERFKQGMHGACGPRQRNASPASQANQATSPAEARA